MAEEVKLAAEPEAEPTGTAGGQKKEQSDYPFAVSVSDVYEGPLDLLLDLIRKQDIDIYDIPIATITAQYLAYVEHLKELDVNVAAEFIYMAAVLIHIKSKMLLPRDPDAPPGEQEDPRAELVNRLIEHEKFKSAAQMLLQKQQIEDAVWSNPALKEFIDAEGTEPEIAADVIDLVKTFQTHHWIARFAAHDRGRRRYGHRRPDDRIPAATVVVGRTSDSIEAATAKRELAADIGLYVPGAARTGATAGYSVAAGKDVRRDSAAQAYWVRSRNVAASRSSGRLEIEASSSVYES